jgi:hypothetical protein
MDGYYVTDTEVAASVSDPSTGSTGSPQAGSGIASLEASQNNAAYAPYSSPLRFGNGWHTYQFKATDKAGNVTDTGVLTMNVDTTVINPKPRAYQPPPSMVYQAPIPTAAPIIPAAIAEVAIVPTNAPALVAVEPPKVVTLKPLESVTVSWTKKPVSPVLPPISNSTILWGAAATAAVGFFLAETKKQREEEALRKIEANQQAREAAKELAAAGRDLSGGGGVKKYTKPSSNAINMANWLNTAYKKIEDVTIPVTANISNRLNTAYNKIKDAALPPSKPPMDSATRSYTAWAKAVEQRKAEELQAGLKAYYEGRKAGEAVATPSPLNKFKAGVTALGNAAVNTTTSALTLVSNFVQTNIPQPITTSAQKVATWTQKNIVPALLTAALGANGVQWVNNIVSNPDLFIPVQSRAELLIEELRAKYPPAPETKTLDYLVRHPYAAVKEDADILNTFTNIAASYADAVWQQNPLVQAQIGSLESLEKSICPNNSNRCTAAFYLPAGLMAAPFDTGLGVVNGLVVDPVAGFLKQGALAIENFEAIPGLVNAVQENGWQGAKDFAVDLIKENLNVVFNDKQVQSALFFETLIGLALVAAPVAGGIVLGATAKGLIDLDIAITTAPSKKSLINLVTSHGVRTTVVSSTLILALMAAGLGNKASEFRSFQESLTPSGQTAFAELSLLEQMRIVDLAGKAKISPRALEYYLTESARPGSPLSMESVTTGLKYANIYTQIDSPSAQLAVKELPFPSQLKIFGLGEHPTPVITDSTPVLKLTPQEIEVLTKISTENYFSNYAVLGTYNGGKGYTMLADKADLTYLNMPKVLYDFYKDYPADFKLINKQYVINLAEQGKPVILSIDYLTIQKWGERPVDERPTTYWEVFEILEDIYHYTLDRSPYSFEGKNYNVLIPPK